MKMASGKGGLFVLLAVGAGGIFLFKHFTGKGGGGVVPATTGGGTMSLGDGQGTVGGPPDFDPTAGPSADKALWMAGGTSDYEAQGLSQRFSQAYAARRSAAKAYSAGPRKAYPSYFWDFRDPGVSYNDNILYNKAPWAAPFPGYTSFWNPQDTTTLKFSGSMNCECCNPRVVPKSI